MSKVSRYRDRRSAQRFQSGDEIRRLGPPGNPQCRTLPVHMTVFFTFSI